MSFVLVKYTVSNELRVVCVPQAIFAYSMYEYQPPKYGDYVYPEWAVYVGWGLAGISLVQIPLWALLTMLYYLCKWVSTDGATNTLGGD